MKLNVYLHFDGNCAAALRFYAEELGGEVLGMTSWGEGPMAEQVDPAVAQRIMHGSVQLGGTQIMGTDGTEPGADPGIAGTHLVYDAGSAEEADRVFALLAEGGEVEMPIEETFWALRFGMLRDQFGVPWMVNCDKTEG